ncbi:hypothetical protein ACFE04_011787 [Oxalis oulophora]
MATTKPPPTTSTSTNSGGSPTQPDPLLDSGSFIIDPNNISINNPPIKNIEPMSHNSSNGDVAPPESVTPAKRAAPVTGDMSWLPAGWLIEERVRSSGATAGTVDRYYFDPASKRRFRSKKEVMYFLENGTLRKKKKEPESSDTGADTAEASGGSKTKKAKSKPTASPSPSSFVFNNVPDKIIWSLSDASKDSWTPSLPGDEKVSDSTREEWAAAFASITNKTTGKKKN